MQVKQANDFALPGIEFAGAWHGCTLGELLSFEPLAHGATAELELARDLSS
jgi:hypothetical protein